MPLASSFFASQAIGRGPFPPAFYCIGDDIKIRWSNNTTKSTKTCMRIAFSLTCTGNWFLTLSLSLWHGKAMKITTTWMVLCECMYILHLIQFKITSLLLIFLALTAFLPLDSSALHNSLISYAWRFSSQERRETWQSSKPSRSQQLVQWEKRKRERRENMQKKH